MATALIETGSKMDELIFQEFKGTGNSEIILDRKVAELRLWPAINLASSGTRKEEDLVKPEVLEKTSFLRRAMSPMKVIDAAETLYDQNQNLDFIIAGPSISSQKKYFKLINIQSSSNFNNKAMSEVIIFYKNKENKTTASGGGAVDATFKAIEKIVKSDSLLRLYSVNNITDGTDSLGEVTVRLEKNNVIVNGLGADSDIVVASAKAYIDALNKLYELLKIK